MATRPDMPILSEKTTSACDNSIIVLSMIMVQSTKLHYNKEIGHLHALLYFRNKVSFN